MVEKNKYLQTNNEVTNSTRDAQSTNEKIERVERVGDSAVFAALPKELQQVTRELTGTYFFTDVDEIPSEGNIRRLFQKQEILHQSADYIVGNYVYEQQRRLIICGCPHCSQESKEYDAFLSGSKPDTTPKRMWQY